MTPLGQARLSTLCGPLSTVVPADSACLTPRERGWGRPRAALKGTGSLGS